MSLAASVAAYLIPVALSWAPAAPTVHVEPYPPVSAQVMPIAPDAVAFGERAPVIYAGSRKAPAPVTDPTPSSADLPPAATPAPALTPPSIKDLWLVSQLPQGVPKVQYSGWVKVTVDPEGRVTEATIAESSGDAEVDARTLQRLKYDRLTPATLATADGTTVPTDYHGKLYFLWLQPRTGE